MKKKISILDCTLRDGGLALEDSAINGEEHNIFKNEVAINFIEKIKKSKIEIIEIGSIEISNDDKKPFSIYQNIEEVSRLIPKNKLDDQIYAALFRGPDTPIADIPKWNPSYCEGIRVIIRYGEIKKSLDFCHALSEKGYKVFIQPMVTMRYDDSEIEALIDAANKMNAYSLYIVDSYGYMQSLDTLRLFQKFHERLSKEIRIGFHSHNNMNLAFSNVMNFAENDTDRSLIIDSTIMGMGQGAGNMQTELLVPYVNNTHKSNYSYNQILEACEIIEPFCSQNLWGYSVTNLLPAINKTAYKFANALRKRHKLSYPQIHEILSNIPEKMRHRYTEENLAKLVDSLND